MCVGEVVVCGTLTFLFRYDYTGKDGGKAKPLKAPKKDKEELSPEDVAFKAKKAAEEKALKEAAKKLGKK